MRRALTWEALGLLESGDARYGSAMVTVLGNLAELYRTEG